eukprot:TRINITY_DN37656_c0_g1_i1.p1 TRINITY_DN37656_c0_g1~~TRINITY_DN37656_c0_g1_i1.p1  ORF type:complete len:1093 (-),score=224.67 TRINITY_DN37656_c0_g1_i1:589-3867(-)
MAQPSRSAGSSEKIEYKDANIQALLDRIKPITTQQIFSWLEGQGDCPFGAGSELSKVEEEELKRQEEWPCPLEHAEFFPVVKRFEDLKKLCSVSQLHRFSFRPPANCFPDLLHWIFENGRFSKEGSCIEFESGTKIDLSYESACKIYGVPVLQNPKECLQENQKFKQISHKRPVDVKKDASPDSVVQMVQMSKTDIRRLLTGNPGFGFQSFMIFQLLEAAMFSIISGAKKMSSDYDILILMFNFERQKKFCPVLMLLSSLTAAIAERFELKETEFCMSSFLVDFALYSLKPSIPPILEIRGNEMLGVEPIYFLAPLIYKYSFFNAQICELLCNLVYPAFFEFIRGQPPPRVPSSALDLIRHTLHGFVLLHSHFTEVGITGSTLPRTRLPRYPTLYLLTCELCRHIISARQNYPLKKKAQYIPNQFRLSYHIVTGFPKVRYFAQKMDRFAFPASVPTFFDPDRRYAAFQTHQSLLDFDCFGNAETDEEVNSAKADTPPTLKRSISGFFDTSTRSDISSCRRFLPSSDIEIRKLIPSKFLLKIMAVNSVRWKLSAPLEPLSEEECVTERVKNYKRSTLEKTEVQLSSSFNEEMPQFTSKDKADAESKEREQKNKKEKEKKGGEIKDSLDKERRVKEQGVKQVEEVMAKQRQEQVETTQLSVGISSPPQSADQQLPGDMRTEAGDKFGISPLAGVTSELIPFSKQISFDELMNLSVTKPQRKRKVETLGKVGVTSEGYAFSARKKKRPDQSEELQVTTWQYLTRDSSGKKQLLDTMEDTVETAMQIVKHAVQVGGEELEALQEENQSLKSQAINLQAEIDELRISNQGLEKVVESRETKIQELTEKLMQVEKVKAQLEEQVKQEQIRVKELKKNNENLLINSVASEKATKNNSRLKKENDKLQAELQVCKRSQVTNPKDFKLFVLKQMEIAIRWSASLMDLEQRLPNKLAVFKRDVEEMTNMIDQIESSPIEPAYKPTYLNLVSKALDEANFYIKKLTKDIAAAESYYQGLQDIIETIKLKINVQESEQLEARIHEYMESEELSLTLSIEEFENLIMGLAGKTPTITSFLRDVENFNVLYDLNLMRKVVAAVTNH